MANNEITVTVEGSGVHRIPNRNQTVEEIKSALAGLLGVTWLSEARIEGSVESGSLTFLRPATATKG